jgi:peptidoglycan hydrolase-like protein with peptidoglycan-binding domain
MAFSEQLHPRGKGATGGQFVAKGNSGASDTVGFDAKRGTGAGYGAKGGDSRVKSLQTYLNSLGFTDASGKPLAVDGKLGPKTTAAIKRLQRKLGLKADGLVTPSLLHQLRQASLRKGPKKPTPRKAVPKRTVTAHHKPTAKTPPKAKTGMGPKPPPKRPSQGKSVGGHLAP